MKKSAARHRPPGLWPLGWLRLLLGRQRQRMAAPPVDAPIHLAPF